MNIEHLKTARKKSGLTQQEVANAIGVVQSAYKNYEQGNREPKGDTVVMLANLFHVTTDYLLGRNTDKSEPLLSPCTTEFFNRFASLTDSEQQAFIELSEKLFCKE